MSSTLIHHLRASLNPVEHYQPRRAPIERLERSADLLSTAPHRLMTDNTVAASALSGPDAAQRHHAPTVPLLAPEAHVDACA